MYMKNTDKVFWRHTFRPDVFERTSLIILSSGKTGHLLCGWQKHQNWATNRQGRGICMLRELPNYVPYMTLHINKWKRRGDPSENVLVTTENISEVGSQWKKKGSGEGDLFAQRPLRENPDGETAGGCGGIFKLFPYCRIPPELLACGWVGWLWFDMICFRRQISM